MIAVLLLKTLVADLQEKLQCVFKTRSTLASGGANYLGMLQV
jgi:hypothetical protein